MSVGCTSDLAKFRATNNLKKLQDATEPCNGCASKIWCYDCLDCTPTTITVDFRNWEGYRDILYCSGYGEHMDSGFDLNKKWTLTQVTDFTNISPDSPSSDETSNTSRSKTDSSPTSEDHCDWLFWHDKARKGCKWAYVDEGAKNVSGSSLDPKPKCEGAGNPVPSGRHIPPARFAIYLTKVLSTFTLEVFYDYNFVHNSSSSIPSGNTCTNYIGVLLFKGIGTIPESRCFDAALMIQNAPSVRLRAHCGSYGFDRRCGKGACAIIETCNSLFDVINDPFDVGGPSGDGYVGDEFDSAAGCQGDPIVDPTGILKEGEGPKGKCKPARNTLFDPAYAETDKNCVPCSTLPTKIMRTAVDTIHNEAYIFTTTESRFTPKVDPNKGTAGSALRFHDLVSYHQFKIPDIYVQIKDTKADPKGRLVLPPVSDLKFEDADVVGYTHMLGDQPGYSAGRILTFDSGKISMDKQDPSIYETVDFVVGTSSKTHRTTLSGASDKFIKSITLNLSTSDTSSPVIHLLFLQAGSKDCYLNQAQETVLGRLDVVIDNISVGTSKSVTFDAGYICANTIEIEGDGVTVKSAKGLAINSSHFLDNALRSKHYSVTFDNNGKLYVFYEDNSVVKCESSSINDLDTDTTSSISSPSSDSLSSDEKPCEDNDSEQRANKKKMCPSSVEPGPGGGGAGGGGGGGGDGGGVGTGDDCFTANTPILMVDGTTKPISAIEVGDEVYAFDTDGIQVPTMVREVFIRNVPAYYMVITNKRTVEVTGGHPFATSPSSFKPIRELKFGDSILVCDDFGNLMYEVIERIIYKDEDEVAVYNMHTYSPNTYFAAGIGVHNKETVPGSNSVEPPVSVEDTESSESSSKSSLSSTSSSSSLSSSSSSSSCNVRVYNCAKINILSPHTISIKFNAFNEKALCLDCEACEDEYGATVTDQFMYIDNSFANEKLCLLRDCDTNTMWENTFDANCYYRNCKNVTCDADKVHKGTVSITVRLTQEKQRWVLEAWVNHPDDKKVYLYYSIYFGSIQAKYLHCHRPTDMINNLRGDFSDRADFANCKCIASKHVTPIFPPVPVPHGVDIPFDGDAGLGPRVFYNSTSSASVPTLTSTKTAGLSEISVAISPDFGRTWYDYKAVVRTIGHHESAYKPVVIHDVGDNSIHLFYSYDLVTDSDDNGDLLSDGHKHLKHQLKTITCQKIIYPHLFDPEDAFRKYKRPLKFNEDTDDDEGLTKFSDSGKTLRKIPSYVVSGVLPEMEKKITNDRIDNGLSYRFNDLNTTKVPYKETMSAFYTNSGQMIIVTAGTAIAQEPSGTSDEDEVSSYSSIDCGDIGHCDGVDKFTLVVSGMDNKQCWCTKISGTQVFQWFNYNDVKHDDQQNFADKKFNDGKHINFVGYFNQNWLYQQNKGEAEFIHRNNLVVLSAAQDSNLGCCPINGVYSAKCQLCTGQIVGTLSGGYDRRGTGKMKTCTFMVGQDKNGYSWKQAGTVPAGDVVNAVYNPKSDEVTLFFVLNDALYSNTFSLDLMLHSNDNFQTAVNDKLHPTFVVGDKATRTLKKANYPYKSDYIFDWKTKVGHSAPTSFVGRSGEIRFFYTDQQAHINGGTLVGRTPYIDAKLKGNRTKST